MDLFCTSHCGYLRTVLSFEEVLTNDFVLVYELGYAKKTKDH